MKDISDITEMWDNRYHKDEYAYGTGPNDFLASMAEKIPAGRALCLGAGEGRNAVYLAKLGFDVTAVDLSGIGLQKARRLAEENKVTIRTIQKDVEKLILAENEWQGITSIFFHTPARMRKNVHKKVISSLARGGVFILEGYSVDQLKFKTGGPPDLELLYDLNEIVNELEDLELFVKRKIVRTVVEGRYHTGKGSVIQVAGIKR